MSSNDVNKRLQEIREEKEFKSVRAFALSIDADPSYFDKIYKGEREITAAILNDLRRVHNLNPKWIKYGQEPKYVQELVNLQNHQNSSNDPKQDTIDILKDQVKQLQRQVDDLLNDKARLLKDVDVNLKRLISYAQGNAGRLETTLECQKLLRAFVYTSPVRIKPESLKKASEEVDTLFRELVANIKEADDRNYG